jgi:hypothetical protein
MPRFLIAPALALATLAAAGGALAESRSSRVDVPRDQWMSVAQIAEHFAAQGYDVHSVETEKGHYEIEAVDKDGRRMEIDAHPVTGDILKQERDD